MLQSITTLCLWIKSVQGSDPRQMQFKKETPLRSTTIGISWCIISLYSFTCLFNSSSLLMIMKKVLSLLICSVNLNIVWSSIQFLLYDFIHHKSTPAIIETLSLKTQNKHFGFAWILIFFHFWYTRHLIISPKLPSTSTKKLLHFLLFSWGGG